MRLGPSRVRALCSRLMMSPRSPLRAQARLRIGGQNPDGGARRFRQTAPRERPHAPDPLSRNGSRPASRSDLKLITPSAVPASRASVRSSVVQRSAVVSASRLWRVSSSERGPSSRMTRSLAPARKP